MSRGLLTPPTNAPVDWVSPINWLHPLNRGLAAWWLFVAGGHSGPQWIDLTRTHTGTFSGTAGSWQGTVRPGGWGAYGVANTTSYVQVPTHQRLNLSETASSVAFWVRCPYAAADFSAWLDKGTGDAGTTHAWALRPSTASADGRATILIEGINATTVGAVFLNAQWCHIVVTWDGTNIHWYRNGVFLESVAQPVGTYMSANASTFNIGALRPNSGSISRSGTRLDDIRLYDSRVLSAGEVAELYGVSQQFNQGALNRVYLPMAVQAAAASVFSRIVGPRASLVGTGGLAG